MRTPGAKGRGQAGLASPAPRPEDLEPPGQDFGGLPDRCSPNGLQLSTRSPSSVGGRLSQ